MKNTLTVAGDMPIQSESVNNVIAAFFDMYTPQECQHEVWNLVQAYSSIPERELRDPEGKGNTIFFCRNINKLIKQLHDLTERNEN